MYSVLCHSKGVNININPLGHSGICDLVIWITKMSRPPNLIKSGHRDENRFQEDWWSVRWLWIGENDTVSVTKNKIQKVCWRASPHPQWRKWTTQYHFITTHFVTFMTTVWVYMLKKKHEVLEKFIEILAGWRKSGSTVVENTSVEIFFHCCIHFSSICYGLTTSRITVDAHPSSVFLEQVENKCVHVYVAGCVQII